MEEAKKKSSGGEDSVWKSLIAEVKEETPRVKSIESPPTKQGAENENSIEKKPIEEPIENPLAKPEEESKTEEKPAERPKKEKKAGKFTTIMITRELKGDIDSKKDPHESYGDFIKRLLEK